MAYLLVFVLAAAAGAAVYYFTLRTESSLSQPGAASQGFETVPTASAPPGGPSAYVPVTGGRPDWQSRLTGFFGLAVAVALGAAALATGIVLGWSMLSRLIGGGEPSGG